MSTLFWTVLSYLALAIVSLRYRIEIKGIKALNQLDKSKGILFLPNHPAHMDPLFNMLMFWPKFRMRPIVVEYIFQLGLLKPFHRLVRSIPIPNFETGVNEIKVKRAEASIQEVAEGLKRGDHFILYPGGRLKSSGKELLGGASGAHELMQECPNVNVVLVRTTGLWGSSFSRALLGKSPELPKTLLHGAKVLFKNFLFFAPRRRVTIEIEVNPVDFPRHAPSRVEFNRYLEKWYNRYLDESGKMHESEPIKLVSYSLWKKEIPEAFAFRKKRASGNGDGVSEGVRKRVYQQIRRILDKPHLELKPEMNLAYDLGMDSLNTAELITYLVKNFDVGQVNPEDLETVGSVLELTVHRRAVGGVERHFPTFTFPEEEGRPGPKAPEGKTIGEAFLRSAHRMGSYVACGDDLLGALTYKKLKKSILVLAQYFRTWNDEKVAVMLPASAGAYIVILALELAQKTPVMLNWTLGSRYLEEMMRLSGASKIVTSQKFIDRLANVQFGKCMHQLVYLEEIRRALSLKMKLRGLMLSICSVEKVLKALNISNSAPPAVVLFTSGTEAMPKGVPLSHENILSNQQASMGAIELDEKDTIYGILPPFHSFGFSVVGLFPLLGGIKVAFYPDPTDSIALAEGVERWKITLFCAAPSFLKGLFSVAKKEQLKGVRRFVSGAEKAPVELFERVKQLKTGASLWEGYGITECSPVLSINNSNQPSQGVGHLLPNIEMITIHPETLEPLPKGGDGEICVRGPSIFHGYLESSKSPFIAIDGKQWYRTGDLGYLDKTGNLILSGRLKRFTKIGGEMISLGAIEETISASLIKQGKVSPDVPSIAMCADEQDGRPKLVLFATVSIEQEEANQILQEAGFSNLIKISSVKQIDDIPIMGAGKTDYRALQSLC